MKLPVLVRSLSLGYLILILIGIWGCAGKPFTPPEPNEIPEGPGLFTKEKGSVSVSVDLKNKPADSTRQAKPETSSEARNSPHASPSDYEEFKAYQQWLEWKASALGSPEYAEFLQWQEWKKDQEWEKSRSPGD
jgi:hypothetical protein